MDTNFLTAVAIIALYAGRLAGGATWYVDGSVPQTGDGKSWQTAMKTIEQALNMARGGQDTILVAEGRYTENVQIRMHPNLRLSSRDPLDPLVVANTILDGATRRSVVTFSGYEGESCVLEGFTITNGAAPHGGGINGNGTAATIRNNIITGNVAYWAEDAGPWGGGLDGCNGLIENNVISDNVAEGYFIRDDMYPGGVRYAEGHGGGLSGCAGTIRNNAIVRNGATGFPNSGYSGLGTGLSACHGTIENNLIADNGDETGVFAVAFCEGTIRGNTITGNVGGAWSCGGRIVANFIFENGGSGLDSCSGAVENNVIYRNSGRGISWATGIMRNNTIFANAGGGVEGPDYSGPYDSLLENCIIWGNGGVGQLHRYRPQPTYSCIQDWTGGGEGNVSEDPRFVDEGRGDVRLRADSPCIDAGFNSPELPEFDIAGMHRIMFGGKSLTVDMGAYEFYINKLEPVPGTNEAIFTWSSLADKTYSIFYSDDLFNWHTAVANFPSSGNQTTSWLDDGSLTGIPPLLAPRRFYRLLENP
ncbi:MAG: right-handed parallel beta-helix repeat-containing protein [bacterium]|nr:right-handed parallel beta-helix repeat-containing protein [bacterium]